MEGISHVEVCSGTVDKSALTEKEAMLIAFAVQLPVASESSSMQVERPVIMPSRCLRSSAG